MEWPGRANVGVVYKFLASKRWIVRTIAGLLLVAVFVRLGIWQLDRNEERSAQNTTIEANTAADPAPVDDVTSPDEPLDAADEWRTVEVIGHYDAANQLAIQLRPVDGERGVHALTPLITDSGAAILVDRGLFATDEVDLTGSDLPAPPNGDVTAEVRVRPSEAGRAGNLGEGWVRSVNVDELADALPYPVYGAWGELISQEPAPDDGLSLLPPPEVDAGPHLSYAIQWFIFACIGVGGFIVLVRAEARGQRELIATSEG